MSARRILLAPTRDAFLRPLLPGRSHAPSRNQNAIRPATSTPLRTSTMTIGTATTVPTTSASTLIIPSSTAASNTLDPRFATASNASIATITDSGSPVAPLKSLPGTGPSARTGAGIAATILSSTKIPTTPAGTCSTTSTPAPTFTSPTWACSLLPQFRFTPREIFCTSVHRFAQQFAPNSIDGAYRKPYLAHQIEPEALELYGSVYKAQQLHRSCAAKLNGEARSLTGSIGTAQQA